MSKRPAQTLRVVASGDAPDALLQTWQVWMAAEGLADRTIDAWPGIIARASRATQEHPLAFTSDALAAWLATKQTPNTKATYFRALTGWHQWLRRTGRRPDDPMLILRRPKVPRGVPHPVSTDGLERLLASRITDRTRCMVLLAAYHGLRIHEIAAVRAHDVDVPAATLWVVGKGGVSAELPLHPRLAERVALMPDRSWWFPSPANTTLPLRSHSVGTTISKSMERARVRGTAHSLRHWYATHLLRNGADVRVVQGLMRHASLATTEGYLEVADGARMAAVLRLPGPRGT